jgi:hypothetical protein
MLPQAGGLVAWGDPIAEPRSLCGTGFGRFDGAAGHPPPSQGSQERGRIGGADGG